MIDRGFVKWQPFNSIPPAKDTIKAIKEKGKEERPTLFPEEVNMLIDTLMDGYYTKDKIVLTYYEAHHIKNITSTIKKIHPNSNTIELGCGKTLYFEQIIHASTLE